MSEIKDTTNLAEMKQMLKQSTKNLKYSLKQTIESLQAKQNDEIDQKMNQIIEVVTKMKK